MIYSAPAIEWKLEIFLQQQYDPQMGEHKVSATGIDIIL